MGAILSVIITWLYGKTMTSSGLATPFSLLHAVSLLSHSSRLEKFRIAIEETVNNDAIVVDLGTGSGVLALFAARSGARRVIGVDINPLCVSYARHAAEINDLSSRTEFVESHFAEFVPSERADVVICEMLSSMMLVEQQVEACAHAVQKVLRHDGAILPRNATVYLVPVECPHLLDRFGVHALRFPLVPQTVDRGAARDLSDAAVLATFDFGAPAPVSVDKKIEFEAVENGTVHGFVGFFEASLTRDIRLFPEDGWRDLLLPLAQPVEVRTGDDIAVRIRYRPGHVDSLIIETLV